MNLYNKTTSTSTCYDLNYDLSSMEVGRGSPSLPIDNESMKIILNYEQKDTLNEPKYKHIGNKIMMTPLFYEKTVSMGSTVLFFQGELYNYMDLYRNLLGNGGSPFVEGEGEDKCPTEHEIIILLYQRFGFHYTMSLLDGRFSLFLLDNNVYNENIMLFVATDPFGCYPLFIGNYANSPGIFIQNVPLVEPSSSSSSPIDKIPAGTYSSFYLSSKVLSLWKREHINKLYFHVNTGCISSSVGKHYNLQHFMEEIKTRICASLDELYNYYYTKYNHSFQILWEIENTVDEPIRQFLYNHLHLCKTKPPIYESFMSENNNTVKEPGIFFKKENINIVISSLGWNDLLFGKNHKYNEQITNCIEYDYIIHQDLHLFSFETPINRKSEYNNYNLSCSPFLTVSFVQYFISIPPEYRFYLCQQPQILFA